MSLSGCGSAGLGGFAGAPEAPTPTETIKPTESSVLMEVAPNALAAAALDSRPGQFLTRSV